MKSSLFSTIIRSFFVALSVMVGIAVGILPVAGILSLAFSSGQESAEIKPHFTPTIQMNAEGVRKQLPKTAPVILKVNIDGFIGSDSLNMYIMKEMLSESREGDLANNRVKAILLHINSPGGTVTDSDGIYRAIQEYKKSYHIPVYGYIDGICASGAMYIAAACDKVYASDVSIVGSIGVTTPPIFNFSGLMEKIGIESKTLISGKGKDSLNPFRPWKPGEEDNFKSLIEYFYQHFVNVMISNRPGLSKEKLINDYGANVFPADQAATFGYIDGSDYSLPRTLSLLTKSIGIEDDYYQVISMERKISFSDLFNRSSPMVTGSLNHKMELPYELEMKFMNQFLYLYLPTAASP